MLSEAKDLGPFYGIALEQSEIFSLRSE
jgi:hypothetical protein